ncbi:hypothetical protein [Archangium sp.]|uniref:hypothetical protein n=1 Tax=Archangium sp. TaxID=1872627 RepID=UPI00286ABE4C|nr:hypothetical protein [Archangium sp.]
MEQKREWTVGASVLRFEPPDLVWADFRGTLTVEDIARLMEIYRELHRSGPFFMVADLRALDTLTEEVRRYFSENVDSKWIHGVIYVGARLVQKAAVKGLLVASWLLGRTEKSELSKIHFASTHAQALELLDRLRAQRTSKVA